ncbi:hypothetical protein ABT104_22835, partial [Streptomyces mobaraensis]
MSRRVSLPGADELFRTTGGVGLQSSAPRRQAKTPADGASAPAPAAARVPGPAAAEPDTASAPPPASEGTADQDAAERRP